MEIRLAFFKYSIFPQSAPLILEYSKRETHIRDISNTYVPFQHIFAKESHSNPQKIGMPREKNKGLHGNCLIGPQLGRNWAVPNNKAASFWSIERRDERQPGHYLLCRQYWAICNVGGNRSHRRKPTLSERVALSIIEPTTSEETGTDVNFEYRSYHCATLTLLWPMKRAAMITIPSWSSLDAVSMSGRPFYICVVAWENQSHGQNLRYWVIYINWKLMNY
jgi:hypothetical protein